jgi:uncharacterized protein YjbJ (UPF0337 family)
MQDHVADTIDRAKGDAKEAAGDLSGNEHLREEGKLDQARGGLLRGVGEVKDRVAEAVDDLKSRHAAREGEAVDAATTEGLQEIDAAQAALQRQLRAGEITQDEYDEAWTSLIVKAPAAVLKASMQQASDDAKT